MLVSSPYEGEVSRHRTWRAKSRRRCGGTEGSNEIEHPTSPDPSLKKEGKKLEEIMKETNSQKLKSGRSGKISKLPYKTPKVTVYGSVSKLTAAKAIGGKSDGVGTKKT